MLFTEPTFLLLFLPIVLGGYFVAPRRARNHVLTFASLAFYAAGEWTFLPWLLASTAASYAIAIGLDRWRGMRTAYYLLILGIAIDLALLVVFKYSGFITTNVNSLLASVGWHPLRAPTIALPLGISFFTFHKISYKVDVWRGVSQVRRDPLDLFLYIALFPQLIAGPIVRYHEIVDELVARDERLDEFAAGVRRFIVGFAKKMLVANTVALCADHVFAIPSSALSTRLAWLGIVCYTLQIYVDFSAYSDMAIGLARMFGFHFPENFNYPYVATSITEFWRRWHMSLSRWFRDYLYIPLGGNRGSPAQTYRNLLIVFLLCGLWHGASWTFVVWGAFHGGWLIVERVGLVRVLSRLPRVFGHSYALVVVMVGWVFFRADSLSMASSFLRSMFGGSAPEDPEHPFVRYFDRSVAAGIVAGILLAIPIVPTVRAYLANAVDRVSPQGRAFIRFVVPSAATVLLAVLFMLGAMQMAADSYNPFIYFRF